MKMLCRTITCGLLSLPVAAAAELKVKGEAILGYGAVEDKKESYGILSMTLSNMHQLGSDMALKWDLRGRLRTDQDELGYLDEDRIDGSIELDLGAAGTLGLSTYNPIDQYPWADGELYNRGSLGVFPVLRKRYDAVADSQFNSNLDKVDPDVLLTYSNKIGPVNLELVANPLRTWDGFDEDEMLETFPVFEGKLTLPTEFAIYSIMYNDVDDAEVEVIMPRRKLGMTFIARYSINEGDWDDARANLGILFRRENAGLFKGGLLVHARDADAQRTMLSLNFAKNDWNVKVAGDTDGDFAIEGSYDFTDTLALQFGWDNGHALMEGFDDAAFPAPVFADARGSAFEIALIKKF